MMGEDRAGTSLPIPNYVPSSVATADDYQVFLNFRGKDTRKGFTDFLYTYLVDVGRIRTFRDDSKLRVGAKIGDDLRKAIRRSEIFVPIFSRNYATSPWCLMELAEMVQCRREDWRKVIMPIFYDVTPSDVRNQNGSFKEAFDLHEIQNHKEHVKEWREALKVVADLKGWELERATNGCQGELVKQVYKEVHKELYKHYIVIPDQSIGRHANNIKKIEQLLELGQDDVKIIGIVGKDGIGKTTMAKVICNKFFKRYECFAYLEEVGSKDLVILQKQLIDSVLGDNASKFNITSVNKGTNVISKEFGNKKVLIVLDHVDQKSQLKAIAGSCDWFGLGSRIIVTTCNKDILSGIATSSYEPRKKDQT